MTRGVFDRARRPAALAALMMGLAVGPVACTSLPDDPDQRAQVAEANDPLEPFNRAVFAFNQVVDQLVLRPIAIVYRDVVPDPGKQAVTNFVNNLRMPVTTVNALLQGDPERAGIAFGRFMVNTIAGIGGIVDVASASGEPMVREDFGQTLGVWGAGEGFYLMLPIIGPSSLRDASGMVVDYFADPVNIGLRHSDAIDEGEKLVYGRTGLAALDTRYQLLDPLDELRRTAVDEYAALRSLYRQRRAAEISNRGEAGPGGTLTHGMPNGADPFLDLERQDREDDERQRSSLVPASSEERAALDIGDLVWSDTVTGAPSSLTGIEGRTLR